MSKLRSNIEILDASDLNVRRKNSYHLERLDEAYIKYNKNKNNNKKRFLKKRLKSILKIFPEKKESELKKERVKSILLIKFGHLGDKLLFEPVPRALRKKFPNAKISLLTNNHSLEQLKRSNLIDNFYLFNHQKCVKQRENKDGFFKLIKLILAIRKNRYSIVMEFKGQLFISLLAIMCGAEYKIGYANYLTNIFYDKNITERYNKHEILRNIKILEGIGISVKDTSPKFIFQKKDNFLAKFIKKNGINIEKKLIGMHIGSGWSPRTYPSKNFASLIDLFDKTYQVILFCGKEEIAVLRDINKKTKRNIIFPGELPLNDFAEVLKLCDVFIASDSGPVHLAQMLNVPTVALFSSGDYIRWGTYKKNSITIRANLACSPCGIEGVSLPPINEHKCMRGYGVCLAFKYMEPRMIYAITKDIILENENNT